MNEIENGRLVFTWADANTRASLVELGTTYVNINFQIFSRVHASGYM